MPLGPDCSLTAWLVGRRVFDRKEREYREQTPTNTAGERAEFFCLPLGENPTAYDCYLVRARDVEPA